MALFFPGLTQLKQLLVRGSFFSVLLLASCATAQSKVVRSPSAGKTSLPQPQETSRSPKSQPTPASYYHTIRGLQYEEKGAYGAPSRQRDLLALKEYLLALEHDPKSAFLMERVARIYHRTGSQRDAAFYAERALSHDPSSVSLLTLLGDIYSASGEMEKGFEAYNKSIQMAPNQRDAYFKIAKVYADNKDLNAAEKMVYKGIEVGPPSPFAYYFLGSLATERKKLSRGLEFHQKALSLDPDFEPAHIGIATIYERQGKIQAAAEVYQHILSQINPNSRVTASRLLQLFMKNRLFDKALDFLEPLMGRDPGNIDLSFQLAQVLIEKKRFAEAIKRLLPVVSARPNDLRLQIYLAALYEENHQPKKAIKAYQAILEKNPSTYDVRIRLGSLYFYALKDATKALAQGNLAKKIAPQRPEAYLFTGLILHDLGRYEEAAETLSLGIEKKPTLPDLHFHLGAAFDKLDRFDDMVQEMERAIELDARYANALNYLGYTFADNGIRLNEAIDLIERALRVRPNDGYFIDSLGWAYYRKGEIQNALRLLKKAVSLVPDDSVIHEHLGEIYLSNGHVQLAREAWLRALSLAPENNPLMQRFKQAGFGVPQLKRRKEAPKAPPLEVH